MEPCMQRALVIAGAVIGAGFASGREVFSFFTRYGDYSWMMILLSAGIMAFLCHLCLERTRQQGSYSWCGMYAALRPMMKTLAEYSVLLLQIIMCGSMISAGGHIMALAFPFHSAYSLGILVTISLALLLGYVDSRITTALGGFLAALFAGAVLAVLVFDGGRTAAVPHVEISLVQAITGFIRAVAYASLNLTISVGIICRLGNCSCKVSHRSSVLFGLLMICLLFIGNYLYLQHPELENRVFPMIDLLARFGRKGYAIGLLLMYLAIQTTLSAGLFALRTGFGARVSNFTSWWLTILLPLAVSFAGFENIVDRWYAPTGLVCLLVIFMPLVFQPEYKGKI